MHGVGFISETAFFRALLFVRVKHTGFDILTKVWMFLFIEGKNEPEII